MEAIIVLVATLCVLFLLAFLTKRRFGVLGLGLGAGYIMNRLWGADVARMIESFSIDLGIVSPQTIAGLLLVLLPSLILLVGGPTYANVRSKTIGSLLFAVLALVFALGPLSYSIVVMGPGRVVFDFIVQYQDYIMTIALAAAVVDMFMVHSSSAGKSKGKH